MALPNAVTTVRIVLSPLFFFVYFMPGWFDAPVLVSIIILWILLFIIELTDLVDGTIARKRGETTDTGKLLDPFADSLSRLTYFLCFTLSGLMPIWIFVIVLYRDLGVSFVRLLVARKGLAMGARISGKVKAWVYGVAGAGGLLTFTVDSLGTAADFVHVVEKIAFAVFIATGAIALWSLGDYLSVLIPKKSRDQQK